MTQLYVHSSVKHSFYDVFILDFKYKFRCVQPKEGNILIQTVDQGTHEEITINK